MHKEYIEIIMIIPIFWIHYSYTIATKDMIQINGHYFGVSESL